MKPNYSLDPNGIIRQIEKKYLSNSRNRLNPNDQAID